MKYEPIPGQSERIVEAVLDGAFQIHRQLGPGLLESIYEICLSHELSKRAISFERQLALPVIYDGIILEAGLRLDFLVDDSVVVELKAVEEMLPLYNAQLLTYLKLAKKRVGLLINVNVPVLKDGIKRMVL